jgi:DNA primase
MTCLKCAWLSPQRFCDHPSLRGRQIFPIRDDEGYLVGFAARRLVEDGSAKYINSSLANGFNKGETLYGLYHAKSAILHTGIAYIVEGYKDCIAMHAAGFSNTVGLMGTTLTDGQQQLLRKYQAKQLILLLDGDDPGRKAAEKIEKQLKENTPFSILNVPFVKDEDPHSLFLLLECEAFVACIRMLEHPSPRSEQLLLATCLLHPGDFAREVWEMMQRDDLPFACPVYNRMLEYAAKGEDMPPSLKRLAEFTSAPLSDPITLPDTERSRSVR